MSEEENQHQGLTRREFLRLVRLGLASAAVGATSGIFIGKWHLDSLPYNPPAEDLLRSTAVALANENKRSQFIEKGKFTKEFFDRCCRGTFNLEAFKDRFISRGTCWLAAIDDKGRYYFVTNRHVIASSIGSPIDRMKLWRPNIDSEAYCPSVVEAVVSVKRDLAVLRCGGNNPNIGNSDVLNWKDNVSPQKGQDFLAVGYPEVFRDINNPADFLTCASFIEMEKIIDPQNGDWMAKGLMGGGGSGSPVIEVDNDGSPRVVGVVCSRGDNTVVGKPFLERRENTVGCCELEVGSLIKVFQSS